MSREDPPDIGRDGPEDAERPRGSRRWRKLVASLRCAAGRQADASPGTRFGDFEILGFLGRGGMGVVYRAAQLSLGRRDVALKIMGAAAPDPVETERFTRELTVLARFHHPHLAEVYGGGAEEGRMYFAMQFVRGPTLDAIRAAGAEVRDRGGGAAVRRRLVERMAEVADALAAIHAAGFIHRDVKPANIAIEPRKGEDPREFQGSAILLDFGLVGPPSHLDPSGRGGGFTESWAAPEQILGLPCDARIDVFGLGATLYDLLTGCGPRHRGRAAEGLPPVDEAVPGIDRDLAAIVAMAVDPVPESRYADGAALREDLRRWLRGEPVAARPPGPIERLRYSISRHSQALALSVPILAALALLVAAILWLGGVRRIARDAQEACREGDLATLAARGRAMPAGLLRSLLLDEAIRDALDAVSDRKTTLGAIAERLSLEDAAGAFREGVAHLRRHGPGSDPVVSRFVLRGLRSALLARAGRSRRGGHPAVRLAARLFYERPVTTSSDAAFSAPFRDVLLGPAARGTPDREDALHVLTALSGCALAEDATGLLEAALRAMPESEEERLGVLAVERIVRRENAAGRLRRTLVESLWRLWDQGGRGLCDPDPASVVWATWSVRSARVALATALGFAARATGADIGDLPGRPLAPEEIAGVDGHLEELVRSWAAAGRPGVLDALEAWSAGRGRKAWLLGWAAGALGDPVSETRAREILAAEGGDAARSVFDRGLEAGRLERSGIIPAVSPDPDTWLDAVPSAPGLRRLATEPGKSAGAGGGTLVARVDFCRAPAGVGSPDTEVLLGDGAHVKDDLEAAWYLRLAKADASRVVVRFTAPPAVAAHVYELDVQHQHAVRMYFPFLGRASLELRLDDDVIGARQLVPGASDARLSVTISQDRLPAGVHEIELRLDETSTTGCWLYSVELRRRPVY